MDLTKWDAHAPEDRLRMIGVLSDSTANFPDEANCWPQKLREILRSVWGYGGEGIIGTWDGKIIYTGAGWNTPLSDGSATAAWQIGMWQEGRTASGATNIATRTLKDPIPPGGGAYIHCVDFTGAAIFSYDWDAAGTWTNVPTTFSAPGTAAMKKIFCPAPAGAATSFRIRAANAAGTAATVFLLMFEFTLPKNLSLKNGIGGPIQDLSIHNFGNSAAFITADPMRSSSNWFDNWMLTQAFTEGRFPDVMILGSTNDGIGAFPVSSWDSMRATCVTRGVDLLAFSYWGQDGREQLQGDTYHDQDYRLGLKAWCATNGVTYIDFYERYGDFNTVNALGWMVDSLHPNATGAAKIAQDFSYQLMRPARNKCTVPWHG